MVRKMDKTDMRYTYNGILYSHKKNEDLPFATLMNLEGIMLSEVRQRKRNMIPLIHGS